MTDGPRRDASRLASLVGIGLALVATPGHGHSKCAKLQFQALGLAARQHAVCAARAAESGTPYDVCVAGTNVDAGSCASVGGAHHPSAVCDPSGACVDP